MKISGMLLTLSALVVGALGGPNEPIADNELGLTAKACAEKWCNADSGSKDGLELWLTLNTECGAPTTKTTLAENADAGSDLWSPTAVGTISALLGVTGLMAGFTQGMRSAR